MNFNLKKTNFNYHRHGWKAATEILEKFHDPKSEITLFDWADREFKHKNIITKPWVGFLHNAMTYPKNEKYVNKILCLRDLVKQDYFLKSCESCKGIFTLSKITASFLERNIDVPITNLYHPIKDVNLKFDFSKFLQNPTVLHIGQWLRNYESFSKLNYTKKLLIRTKGIHDEIPNVESIEYVDNQSYDELLSRSIVFLDLYDSAACNTLLECIVRNTPIVINPLPATVEYLGPKYPLFYEGLTHASEILQNNELIHKAHKYLINMRKTHLNQNSFQMGFSYFFKKWTCKILY